ncbi:Transcriptional regulator, contains XRE-family HTH domain [Micromonospora nigra]|uniref:Transcriptional regulator, contains XRE-family HTH domain n=1 Tax=Micromonospora nigra TaxID=145857 RepID=A0A1C6R9S0_9ACTN|nr:tetratricopeptide repeat protein [Micromonospora nigra]SCL13722.1 Transcriptional regulator, contains XRE-family HTH domain [Micromonospora nigra]
MPVDGGFGDLLRALRRRRGLTQEDLAEASGSSVRGIREMENGRVRSPQRRTVALLADALDLDATQRRHFLDRARPPAPAPPGDGCPTTRPTEPEPPGAFAAGGPADHPPPPAELPAAIPDLTGRADELAAVRRLAADRPDTGHDTGPRVAVLHGPAGTGKTSLAVAAGHRISSAYPDGQLFVDLHGATPSGRVEPTDALAGLLRSLGAPDDRIPADARQRGNLFRTLTRDRRLLLVVDDAADEAQVRPLLPAGSRCLVLVTARRPLAGLAGAVRLPLDVLDPAAARELLSGIVDADRVSADPAGVDQLVMLCGRLPLALRVAGNRLATRPGWPVRHLVDQLRDQRRRLTALTAGDVGVRAAFAVSYRQLGTPVAAVFRRASLIPGSDFDVDLVAAVAGTDTDTALASAEELVDAGLLSSCGDRYQFHDLVRLFAQERLDADDSPQRRRDAHDGMVTWLLTRAERAAATFDPAGRRTASPFAGHRAAADWLDREAGHWLAALRDAARQGRHADVVRVARALHWYSDVATHRHGWDEIFSLGVTAAQALRNPHDEVVLLNFLGWARYHCRDRHTEALDALDRALDLAARSGDLREEAWALTYRAAIGVRTGRADLAVPAARRALALFRQVRYELGEWCAANVQGVALTTAGRFAEAAELHRAALVFYRGDTGLSGTGALVGQASTTMSLAAALAGLGRWREAAGEYARAGQMFRQAGSTFGEATAAYRHGLALRELGDTGAARTELRRAQRLFASVSSPWWEAQALAALATVAPAGPDGTADARLLRRRALDRCGELDAPEVHGLRARLRRELAE